MDDAAAAERAEDEDFIRRYGPWQPFTLAEAKALFDPIGIAWWVAGGQAAEAFHQVSREHEDIDISLFRKDVPALKVAMEGKFDIWSAGPGGLRPVDKKFPLPADEADQVWLREHAMAPWRADIVMNPDEDGRWVSRRDTSFNAPLGEVTWERDGIRFLNPEIVLAFKARLQRTKDEHDFTAIAPKLDDRARSWLADYLDRCERPDHPWRARL